MAIRNSAKTSADIKNSLDDAIKTYFEEAILILWRGFWKEEQLNKIFLQKKKKKREMRDLVLVRHSFIKQIMESKT